MSQRVFLFGIHDFLNAQPLLTPLFCDEDRLGMKVVVDVPARLADRLKSGELDLAMIPTIEFLRNTDKYRLAPGLCIASRGEVKTVLLVCRVPLDRIRSLAVDQRSRTSAALLEILFSDRFSPGVEFHECSPDPEEMLKGHDAALIIGDQALEAPNIKEVKFVYDLSQEWFERTGKTFVHAVVAVRAGVHPGKELLDGLSKIWKKGLAEIDSILSSYTEKTGMDPEVCRDYLENKIIYDLGSEELAGIETFKELAGNKELVNSQFPLRFVDSG